MRTTIFALASWTTCALLALAADAATLEGVTDGGAHYKIEVPDPWNGDLVIWKGSLVTTPRTNEDSR